MGTLAPQGTEQADSAAQDRAVAPETNDSIETAVVDEPEGGTSDLITPGGLTFVPSAMGLSFQVAPEVSAIRVQATWGRYEKKESITQMKDSGAPERVWKRRPITGLPLVIPMMHGLVRKQATCEEFPDVVVQGRVRRTDDGWIVTLFLVNAQMESDGTNPKDSQWIFQPKLTVTDNEEPERPIFTQRRTAKHDLEKLDPVSREETETLSMLYRRQLEYAVGHSVSVHATLPHPGASRALKIETTFMPTADAPQFTPPTATDNPALAGVMLDMKELALAEKPVLLAGLRALESAYGEWIQREAAKVNDPAEGLADHAETAARQADRCRRACARIREGIEMISNDPMAEKAFRFANEAMWQQRIHAIYARQRRKGAAASVTVESGDEPANRSWRPFQLAFILLNLASITRPDHPDRSDPQKAVADLLWFPTGGGKTEAYLGLTAYTFGLRRLQGALGGLDAGNGLSVLMRYTLRLLTLQQFQRAAALLCACEVIRKADAATWGTEPFRIGLWVGAKTTPNTLAQADEAVKALIDKTPLGQGSPHQILSCPWCGCEVKPHHIHVYQPPNDVGRCVTYCGDALGQCEFSQAKAPKEGLPVMVVDEEIYRRPPALLIATIDKFAQMAWKGEVQMLFGKVSGECSRHGFLSPEVNDTGRHPAKGGQPATTFQEHPCLRPPDLIIQDELHLISGPLGTLAALYETAVDELCSWQLDVKTIKPKIIASTATIRRAPEQMRKLFARKLEIFPPQGTDVRDSFFALQRQPGAEFPGRRYVGICAFGRRFPAALIRVYVALLGGGQSLFEKNDGVADPWMTLTGYFNSIRELAGTRRLVEDDIRNRLRQAELRGLAKRLIGYSDVDELTSRKAGSDIPRILERLEVVFDQAVLAKREADRKAGVRPLPPRPLDVVLATNMISVGVDVDRLGLMVVAGQPKTTSEYIQATSRVGRSRQAPGLVVTLYNWARPRDLSHYETFEHYHETFYQHVEALSLTPLASRALERGLSGVFVSLMRLGASHLNANAWAGRLEPGDPHLAKIATILERRADYLKDDEHDVTAVQSELEQRKSHWLKRVAQQEALNNTLGYKPAAPAVVNLLHPAGEREWQLFTCLNSLRDVEGEVNLLLSPNGRGLTAHRASETETDPEDSTPTPSTSHE